MQKRIEILECKVVKKQKTLMQVDTKASEEKKEHLNSMEDVKCYHHILIDTKEQYWVDVETFVNVA